MTPEEIKKGAPDGATHYQYIERFKTVEYYQFTDGNNRDYLYWNSIVENWVIQSRTPLVQLSDIKPIF